jgi:hypothetical protein
MVFGAVLVAGAVIGHAVVYGMYKGMRQANQARQPVVPPVARELPAFPRDLYGKESRVPQPHLQVHEHEELEELRRLDQAELNAGPAWVNRRQGIVRLPVDEVMHLIADPKTAAALGVRTLTEKGR